MGAGAKVLGFEGIFHREDTKGAKVFCFVFWRAVRGSARVLALTGNKLWSTKIQRARGFGFCLGEPGAGAPGPLVLTQK